VFSSTFTTILYTYLVENYPASFLEATSVPYAKQWDKAIKNEVESIQKNNT